MSNVSEEEVSRIVAKSIQLVLSGKSSIESILFRYPELADVLRAEIETAMFLERVSPQFGPSPGFVKRSKASLMERIEQEAAYEKAAYGRLVSGGAKQARGAKAVAKPAAAGDSSWLWRFASFAAVLMFLFVSFTGTVYASRDTVPGDGLYGFKRWTEETSYSLTSSPVQQARMRLAFSSRRLDEARTLLHRNQSEQAAQVLEEYEREVAQAIEVLNQVQQSGDQSASQLADEMSAELDRHTERLKTMAKEAPGSIKVLDAAMETSTRGSDQVETMGKGRPTEATQATPGAPSNGQFDNGNQGQDVPPGQERKTDQPSGSDEKGREKTPEGLTPTKDNGPETPRETKTPKPEDTGEQPKINPTTPDNGGDQGNGGQNNGGQDNGNQDKDKPDKPDKP